MASYITQMPNALCIQEILSQCAILLCSHNCHHVALIHHRPAKENSLDENGAVLMLAIYDHDVIGSNDFAGLCVIAGKDIPRLSARTSTSDPDAVQKRNLILPLFTPPETIAFRELEMRHHLNDSDATNFWKSQRKFMEKIFSHPASGRGIKISASSLGKQISAASLGKQITAAFDSLNINTRS